MSKSDKLNSLEKSLNKKYGEIFLSYDNLEEIRGDFTSIGLGLDIGLHGGIMDGTVTSISGVPGSGKTTLCLTFIANAQKRGKKCYYIDVEGRLQPELLESIPGLDLEALKIIRSTQGNFITAEKYINIITALISSEPNIVIILDSVASLCDDATLGAEAGESRKMMNIPTLMYQLLRKSAQILPSMQSNLFLITHIQANPSPYGAGYSEVGGNAIKFQASYRMTCLSSSELPKDGKKLWRESKFKISKTATGPGTGEAVFVIKYGKGYDREYDIFNLASEMGIIEQSGAWYSFINSKNEEIKLQGKEKFVEFLVTNPSETDALETKIRGIVFDNV